MKWCPVHKRFCDNTLACIQKAVKLKMDYDAADFIIEKSVINQPSWHNSRINYRLYRWSENSRVKNFEGDYFWIGNLYAKLRNEFGLSIDVIQTIPIVDMTEVNK